MSVNVISWRFATFTGVRYRASPHPSDLTVRLMELGPYLVVLIFFGRAGKRVAALWTNGALARLGRACVDSHNGFQIRGRGRAVEG